MSVPKSVSPSADVEGGECSAHTITGLGHPLPETSLLVLITAIDCDLSTCILAHTRFGSSGERSRELTTDVGTLKFYTAFNLDAQSLSS